ncbi:hypothetical protein [Lentibacillus sp. Marseille-P4043]|uniref:hypothetical protein n=1 Tax=Lentibacillus sp. Marseille-P4043 TaxID=2040293 RepID=UPI000D0AD117|nr:hypothetical protein [Lentibacillus sp. Marseille-P4043]
MKKFCFIIIALFLTVATLLISTHDFSGKNIVDTLQVNPTKITKIVLKVPSESDYHHTTDKTKIETLINYLDQVHYKRMQDAESSSMPMKASIIYLYEEDKVDFIVPYQKGVMISQKVFKVENGIIENTFIKQFYDSLDEE